LQYIITLIIQSFIVLSTVILLF